MSKLTSILPATIQLMKRSDQIINHQIIRTRKPSHCRGPKISPCKTPRVFDVNNVRLERSVAGDAPEVRKFLHRHFWPSEPSTAGLWVPLDSPYLEYLTYKCCTSVYRVLAVERNPETGARRLVGLYVSSVMCPWQADELDRWADCTDCVPSRNRLHFCAHLLRSPNLFAKYKVPVILEVETLAVDQEVNGHGIGRMLMKHALDSATDLRYPLIQVICTSAYTAKICERLGMQREWSMKYEDFKDNNGRPLFIPSSPHLEVAIYTKRLGK